MDNDFFAAAALVFILEGLLPFISPGVWRQTMARLASKNDDVLRKMGFFSMLFGVGLLYLVR